MGAVRELSIARITAGFLYCFDHFSRAFNRDIFILRAVKGPYSNVGNFLSLLWLSTAADRNCCSEHLGMCRDKVPGPKATKRYTGYILTITIDWFGQRIDCLIN